MNSTINLFLSPFSKRFSPNSLGTLFDGLLKKNDMSKKTKIKYKKEMKAFLKSNKILLAALGGAAAGVTLAGIFGTEKGKEILDTVENSIADTAERISNGSIRRVGQETSQVK